MGLVTRNVTSRFRTSNHANSRRSTGPRTLVGKRNSSRNSKKHGIFSAVSSAALKELGENPAQLQALHKSLIQTIHPADAFEEMIVEDIAVLRWRMLRVRRAEPGILAMQRSKLEIDRDWEDRISERAADKGMAGAEDEPVGLTAMGFGNHHASASILEELETVRQEMATRGFNDQVIDCLRQVYGDEPGFNGRHLIGICEEGIANINVDTGKLKRKRRDMFMQILESEIAAFEDLAALSLKRVTVSECERASQLLLAQPDMEKLLKYESHIERQLKRKLDQLVAWRREKLASVRAN